MARYVLLTRAECRPWALGLGLLAVLGTWLPAQTMMEMAAKPAPSAPATNAAAGAPPPPDPMSLYGKIVVPGTDVAHPLKLNMSFADVGEVKVPSNDELQMRDKLEELAKLSDADIRQRLAEWPAFAKMSLHDEGVMLQRIQDFRDRHAKVAQGKQHEMGLLTLTPDQEARFEKEYWEKRLQMDHELAKQFQPIMAQHMQKLQEDLFREFSVASPVPPPAPPKPAPATKSTVEMMPAGTGGKAVAQAAH